MQVLFDVAVAEPPPQTIVVPDAVEEDEEAVDPPSSI